MMSKLVFQLGDSSYYHFDDKKAYNYMIAIQNSTTLTALSKETLKYSYEKTLVRLLFIQTCFCRSNNDTRPV